LKLYHLLWHLNVLSLTYLMVELREE
jgi:hypothetical protein